jgi:hypothetical protein
MPTEESFCTRSNRVNRLEQVSREHSLPLRRPEVLRKICCTADIANDVAGEESQLGLNKLLEIFLILHLRKAVVKAVNASDYGRQEMSDDGVHMTAMF